MTDTADLQFERAHYDEAAATPACAVCQTPLYAAYFEANGQTVCERCCFALRESSENGSPAGRLLRAAGAGLGTAFAGSILYWAILAMTGYEFGLIAIVVGFAVGKAVHWGSQGRGGWGYQSLAMALTYLSIVGAYVPMIFTELAKEPPAQAGSAQSGTSTPADEPLLVADGPAPGAGSTALALVALLAFILVLPFLGGISNVIGLIIIGIGLYEAWKLNRRQTLVITGPHVLAAATPAVAG